MAFWSTERFKEKAKKLKIVTPWDESRLAHGAYEMTIGDEAIVSNDCDSTNKRAEAVINLVNEPHFSIPPGQFAMLITAETVNIPEDSLGFISMRAKIKFRGLINISGFHVDPGFRGPLKFSVYNAGTNEICLRHGDKIFLLWIADLDRATKDIYGALPEPECRITSQNVTDTVGEVPSLVNVSQRISELQKKIDSIESVHLVLVRTVYVAVFSCVLAATIAFIGRLPGCSGPIPVSTQSPPLSSVPIAPPEAKAEEFPQNLSVLPTTVGSQDTNHVANSTQERSAPIE